MSGFLKLSKTSRNYIYNMTKDRCLYARMYVTIIIRKFGTQINKCFLFYLCNFHRIDTIVSILSCFEFLKKYFKKKVPHGLTPAKVEIYA